MGQTIKKQNKKDGRWVRCDGCGHKLFYLNKGELPSIEIKCHSCKKIVKIRQIK